MKKRGLAFILSVVMASWAIWGCGPAQTAVSSAQGLENTGGAGASGNTGDNINTGDSTNAGNSTTAGEASGDPVKFLAYACITGNNSESGRQVTMACETAEWYINHKLGGFPALGGRPVKIEILDSTSDAATATLPLERELSKGGYCAVIGNSNSSIALTMLPILEKYQVPAVTGAAANKAVSEQGCSFSFQPAATSSSFIPTQLDFLEEYAKRLNKDVKDLKLGLVYANDAWGTDQANNTRARVKERGLNLAVDESYEINTFTDAGPLVTKLKNSGVDVMLPSSYPNDIKLIFTAMNSLNYAPLVVGGGAAMTWPSLYKDLGDSVNGITSVDSWCWDQKGAKDDPKWMEMNRHYEDTYGEFIPGQAGPTLYSIMLAYAAVNNAGDTDPVKVRDELRKLNSDNCEWFKILNGYGDFDDETGLNTDSKAVIMQWQNGKPTCVFPGEYAASPLLNPETMQPYE